MKNDDIYGALMTYQSYALPPISGAWWGIEVELIHKHLTQRKRIYKYTYAIWVDWENPDKCIFNVFFSIGNNLLLIWFLQFQLNHSYKHDLAYAYMPIYWSIDSLLFQNTYDMWNKCIQPLLFARGKWLLPVVFRQEPSALQEDWKMEMWLKHGISG